MKAGMEPLVENSHSQDSSASDLAGPEPSLAVDDQTLSLDLQFEPAMLLWYLGLIVCLAVARFTTSVGLAVTATLAVIMVLLIPVAYTQKLVHVEPGLQRMVSIHRVVMGQDDEGHALNMPGFALMLYMPVQIIMFMVSTVLLSVLLLLRHWIHSDNDQERDMLHLIDEYSCLFVGVHLLYSCTNAWRPSDAAAALHSARIQELSETDLEAKALRDQSLGQATLACQRAHLAHLGSVSFSAIGKLFPIVANIAVIVSQLTLYKVDKWPTCPSRILVMVLILATGLTLTIPLHFFLAGECLRTARFCIFRQQYFTVALRDLSGQLDQHAPRSAQARLQSWLVARNFVQRNDVNFLFKAFSPVIASLILLCLGCSVTILLDAYDIARLDKQLLAPLVGVAVWAMLASLYLADFINNIFTTQDQVKALQLLRLEPNTPAEVREYLKDLVAFIQVADEPPYVRGIPVKPDLLKFLYGTIASLLGGLLISVITTGWRREAG